MNKNLDIDNDEDIDELLECLNTVRAQSDNAAVLKNFTENDAYGAIVLLGELKKRRHASRLHGGTDGGSIGSHRIILEGFSEDDMQESFSNALEKAYGYFSENHDVSITVLDMAKLPKIGFRSTIEIHITPMTSGHVRKIEGADLELKHNKSRTEKPYRAERQEFLGHLMHDHFIMTSQETYVPDYLMVSVNDAQMLNFMAEHDFFKAAHERDEAEEPEIVQKGFVVRMLENENDS